MKTKPEQPQQEIVNSTPFHSVQVPAIFEWAKVDSNSGLSDAEVLRRRNIYGRNELSSLTVRSRWATLADQVKSVLTLLLVVATIISIAVQDYAEALAISIVIAINTAIGFIAERRAISSMASLRRLGVTASRVRRNGQTVVVAADELVPGDVVKLDTGDVVTADIRLTESSGLACDESLLTGESVPVNKTTDAVDQTAMITDRSSMVFKGTSVTRGRGEGVVVATGFKTELGQIANLVDSAEDEVTPLEQRLNDMSQQLMWVAIAVGIVVLLVGIGSGRDSVFMMKTGIALAIAAIPEGLPIVATLALARGMWRLARRNALVKRLSAVETLGSVTVIFTDKTGTLTENKMVATQLVLSCGVIDLDSNAVNQDSKSMSADRSLVQRAALVLARCNGSEIHDGTGAGDPMEVALLHAAKQLIQIEILPKVCRTVPFDPETRMMTTFVKDDASCYRALVKGAPEAVLSHSKSIATVDGDRALTETDLMDWEATTQRYAAQGFRVLALADRKTDSPNGTPCSDLTLLGLVILHDPPRADARPAVLAARRAGIVVIMTTGDNAMTAASIARQVGLSGADKPVVVEGKDLVNVHSNSAEQKQQLLNTQVFARVSPKQKLELIALFQEAGEIVAMTGDGVNDAPALKKADIGIAMGARGAPVAKEASDIVLKDDAFPSIVAAIYQGRTIFDNIRKFVIYLLSCNLSEVLVVAVSIASGLPLPLVPLQILFLNLVTDVFPALALGFGEGDDSVLERPPRKPSESLLTRKHWYAVVLYGLTITACVLGAFNWALNQPDKADNFPITVAFLTLALSQMWHVLNMRSRLSNSFKNEITRNVYIWIALTICASLLVAAIYTPAISSVLMLVEPDPLSWAVIVGASLVPMVIGQLLKADFFYRLETTWLENNRSSVRTDTTANR